MADPGRPARILAIIGSGETTPTLARIHRRILERLGPPPVPGCVIDTPYGFQENADDITGRTLDYFRETVGTSLRVATFRDADEADPLVHATAVARIREARFVFAGPGSPSYALRNWTRSALPDALAEKLSTEGALVFASAAALTLGVVTVPVYEIYKVGEPPHWLEGLDLLSNAARLRVAVVPHYDNNEGGNHDTRFCYLGESRLAAMERQLPADVFVLGVDGHTALLIDLEARTATVAGLGGVTVRAAGRSRSWPAGTSLEIDELRDAAEDLRRGANPSRKDVPDNRPVNESTDPRAAIEAGGVGAADVNGRPEPASPGGTARSPLAQEVARIEGEGTAALDSADVASAVSSILRLERTITEWSRDPGRTEDFDHARMVLHDLVVRLGERAETGSYDPRALVGPFVEALIALRSEARASRDWGAADAIRDRLLEAGIEIRDGASGTEWELVEDPRLGAGFQLVR